MWRKGLCFITNAVSSASNLGYVLSRVCMLHDQSPSTGLMGSVMTKAISIETALLVSLPAEWPAAPHRCAFIFFWYNKLIAINLIKAARQKKKKVAFQMNENSSRLNLPSQTSPKLCRCIRIAGQSILYWSILTLGGLGTVELFIKRIKGQTDVITTCFSCPPQECHHVSSQIKKPEAVHSSNHRKTDDHLITQSNCELAWIKVIRWDTGIKHQLWLSK